MFILLIMIGMIIAGSFCTILGKLMDQKIQIPTDEVDEEGNMLMMESEFKHPLLMNLLMFTGEASLLIVLKLQLSNDQIAKSRHEQNRANRFLFTVPALLDTCGSYLNFAGLALISASSYQILKMLSMVFVVALSKIFFQRSYLVMQYIAILIVISGLTVVTMTDLR